MYKILHTSPMIPSYDVPGTARFFTELLSYSILLDGNYVVLQKDGQLLHIQKAGDIGEMSFYLQVDDIDALWDTIKDKVHGLKVKAPFNQDYGMRELHIEVPHTKTLLFIGSVLPATGHMEETKTIGPERRSLSGAVMKIITTAAKQDVVITEAAIAEKMGISVEELSRLMQLEKTPGFDADIAPAAFFDQLKAAFPAFLNSIPVSQRISVTVTHWPDEPDFGEVREEENDPE